MLKIIIKIFIIIGLTVIQLAFVNKLMIWGAIPNLILICAIILLFRGRLKDSLLICFVGGIFLDLASPLRFGLNTLLFVIIILGIYYLLQKIFPTPNLIISFLIFFFAFIFLDLIIFLIIKLMPTWQILFEPFINAIIGILFYRLSINVIETKEEIKIT